MICNGLKDVLFSLSVVSNSSWPHGLQHARPPCPSLSPRACSNPCPLSRWCHPTVSSSVAPFSSCPRSVPASGSFPMSVPYVNKYHVGRETEKWAPTRAPARPAWPFSPALPGSPYNKHLKKHTFNVKLTMTILKYEYLGFFFLASSSLNSVV